ncbi:peptidase M29 [Ilumatobacter sp.]|uniref:peptidase M29 n=1 Tax=Ilumatobacter sp. TaxID=1967498 RepID=UPI003C5080F2
MTDAGTEWRWVQRYAEQFAACNLRDGEVAVLLYEASSSPLIVETARMALEMMGAAVAEVRMPTPPNPGPLPIRSTGASLAIANNRAAIAALRAADFVVDCTVEGLLHAPELGEILNGGARVLMVSAEHPENAERWPHDPTLADRVDRGVAMLESASRMRVTSEAGTDLAVDLTGAFRAGSCGWCTEPGSIAHWPGGLVLAFPASNCVDGVVVLAPGDVNLTFKEYVREPITLTVEHDYVVDIAGAGHDAELMRSYLAAFDEPDAYAISHIGWGMNPAARWESLAMWDKADMNGTELRAFAGNVVFSTGANEVAGRFCRGHFDLPMRNCSVEIDGESVVDRGVLRSDLA